MSVRDNHLSRLQSELASLGEEREKERAELEVVVLELQQELYEIWEREGERGGVEG